jgi:hypothetical protein
MSLAPGSRVGAYEITGLLGAGGMGEVYRARDSKLKRDVAIKVLPADVASDRERLARFQREAEVLASLNHPHIAHIYGIEDGTPEGVPYERFTALIMELVEGEDLSQRIARGPIPIDEALPIARQIAEALEAAHEQGVIHRDLKPANIKVRPDGTVKVLDFGLAKALDPSSGLRAPGSTHLANSPTITSPMTMHGLILGTAAYMAPEQAKGRTVDKRADVWAFGVVLYEMLTGAKAFPGEDISDTLATLLKFDPDWKLLPPDTPPSIRRLLKRCLTKEPKLRLRECGSAIADIQDAMSGDDATMIAGSSADGGKATGRGQRWLLPALATSLVALAAVTAWALWGNRAPDAPQPTRRFTITLPEPLILPRGQGTQLALSADGRTLIYRGTVGEKAPQMFRRSIDQFEGIAIPGTENAREPFIFSPDGQWVAFRVEDTLRKVALAGGPPQALITNANLARGGSWGADGRIILGQEVQGGGLIAVPAAGGEPTLLLKIEGQRTWYPHLLPGGKAVLFTVTQNIQDSADVHVLKLDSGEQRMVLRDARAGRLLPSGHLVFVRSGALWAVPFDLDRLEPIGDPTPVVTGVRVEAGGAVQYAVSDEGTLAYIPGTLAQADDKTLVLAGPDGASQSLGAPPRDYQDLALSPDETRVAVQVDAAVDADIWVVELARGTVTRVTNEPGFDGSPLWSLDGKSIVYGSSRDDRWTLHRKSADGTGAAALLASFEKVTRARPYSWSSDGGLLVEVGEDIFAVPVDGKGQPRLLIKSAVKPMVSPDGRWIAYGSLETGQAQVYLQSFPALGERRVASVGVGHSASWSRDGRTLFYLRGGPPNAIMRVSFQANQAGRVDIGTPEVLAPFRYDSRLRSYRAYEVLADGKRVLVIAREGTGDTSSVRDIHVVLNWFEELKRLVPLP